VAPNGSPTTINKVKIVMDSRCWGKRLEQF